MTELGSQWASPGHHPNGRRAGFGAVSVETDASGQRFRIRLFEAGVGAHLTRDQTLDTGFKTGMRHCAVVGEEFAEIDCGHDELQFRTLRSPLVGKSADAVRLHAVRDHGADSMPHRMRSYVADELIGIFYAR